VAETDRTVLTDDKQHAESDHDHGHGRLRAARDWTKWPTSDELPHARLYPQEMQAVSWHHPLNEPDWIRLYSHMRDEDPVLGLYLNGQARALPWWIMKNHHAANLLMEDLPVLVTLCEMCSGAAAFRAEVEGRRLMFRLRGQYNATILLADESTGSLWSPFTGVALAGTMRGVALERLPLSQCLWREWLAMHPTTQVAYGEQTLRGGHGSDHSPGSPGIGQSFLSSLANQIDGRLPYNTLVLGVECGASARAYPLAALAQAGPAVNDSLGGMEMLVRCRPGSLQALAFSRRVGDQVLVFGSNQTGEVRDEQTKSVWNEMGEAVSGPLAGTRLLYLPSGVEEWYVFAAYHPKTEIFEASSL
jgi:hypothetical protein